MTTAPTPRTDAKAKWVSLGTVDTLFADYDESQKIECELAEAEKHIKMWMASSENKAEIIRRWEKRYGELALENERLLALKEDAQP